MAVEKVGYNIYSGVVHRNAGGPAGYLYQLKSGLEKLGITDIRVISSVIDPKVRNSNVKKFLEKLYKFTLMNLLPEKYFEKSISVWEFTNREIIKKLLEVVSQNEPNPDIAFLHFHSVVDISFYSSIRTGNKIQTVLTSHSPEAFHIEQSYGIRIYLQRRVVFKTARSLLLSRHAEYWKRIDHQAFLTADYLMFPCEEAMEPYFETWPDFKEIVQNKRIFFVPSGVCALEHNLSREQIREKYGIPRNAFVVSYVGRHNHVKGYDLLCKAAEVVWRQNPSVYFLIAGNEYPIRGLRDKRWVEVGWTNMPGNIVNASDVFVLPNRRTFFDLVLLEVMSIGKPIIASFTGGNKFVSRQTKGVITFERENHIELAKKILDFSVLSRDEIEMLGLANKTLYDNYYTPEQFALRYRKEVGKIFFGET